ncbi:MAG: LysM domain-containing protein [Planctomycetota bacterium]
MTAAYKLALAAGGLLLLIVIASLILRSDNDPADLGDEESAELVDATSPPPPPGETDAGAATAAADPPGPPPPTRIVYPDDAPAVEVPVDPTPRANASLTVGRSPLDVPDPFALGNADAGGVGAADGPDPEPIAADDLPPVLTAEAVDDDPQAIAPVETGIPLRPIDRPGTGPDDPTPPAPPPAPPVLRTHVVASGETMSSIALDAYGSAARWSDIANANPLVDPNRLRVGQELRLPDLSATTATPEAMADADTDTDDAPRRGTTYVVQTGDTLSGIAVQFYNAAAKWELIYQANRDVIGDDPGRLRADMTLRIPPPDRGAE